MHAVLDAGRGEFYYGEYVGRRCVREVLMHEGGGAGGCGVGLWWCVRRRWRRLWRGLGPRVVEEPLAGDALPFALERIAAGDFDDAATLDANYLRRTDAEIFAKPAAQRAAK